MSNKGEVWALGFSVVPWEKFSYFAQQWVISETSAKQPSVALEKNGLQTKPFVQYGSVAVWALHTGTCMHRGRKPPDGVVGLTEQCFSWDTAGLGVAESEREHVPLQILQTWLQGPINLLSGKTNRSVIVNGIPVPWCILCTFIHKEVWIHTAGENAERQLLLFMTIFGL